MVAVDYQHTQTGRIHYLLYAAGVGMLAGAWRAQEVPGLPLVLLGAGLLVIVFGLSFHYLRVEDDGDSLALRYGPLPLFHKRLAYAPAK